MAPTNFVMKRYLTAGTLTGLGSVDGQVTRIDYRPFGSDENKEVFLETPIPKSEIPDPGEDIIVIEFPNHVVWMPPEHFNDQFTEV